MVATSGPGWTLAPSLVALIAQADEQWPNRSRASDGSIGDAAHRARRSDHNPDGTGDVLAVDITEDHDHGPDLDALWRHLIGRRDPRVRYVIYDGLIVKGYVDPRGRPPWIPQLYTGPNPHDRHLHVSVWDTPAAKTDTSPWFPQEDDPMTADQFLELLQDRRVRAELREIFRGELNTATARGYQTWADTFRGLVANVRDIHTKLHA